MKINNESFEDHLKEFYRSQKLSEQELLQYREMLSVMPTSEKNSKWFRFPILQKYRVAASIVFLLMSLGSFYFIYSSFNANQICSEIAFNHKKSLDPEFHASNFNDLSNQMKKLDFDLISSPVVEKEDIQLIGARYCSLKKNIAGQAKLKDQKGKIYTLYQCKLDTYVWIPDNYTVTMDGIQVKLWKERGLLLGLASNI